MTTTRTRSGVAPGRGSRDMNVTWAATDRITRAIARAARDAGTSAPARLLRLGRDGDRHGRRRGGRRRHGPRRQHRITRVLAWRLDDHPDQVERGEVDERAHRGG